MLNQLLKLQPTKSNLHNLYFLRYKLMKASQGDSNISDIAKIDEYFGIHKVRFIDLTGKKIAGNSVQVIGWEHDPTLSADDDQEICLTMLKPAIKLDKEFIDYGQCIGAINHHKLLKTAATQSLPNRASKSDITKAKKIHSIFPNIGKNQHSKF